jgi:Ca-activated chloride channel family protein
MLLLTLLALPMAVVAFRHLQMKPVRRWTAILARTLLLAVLSAVLAGATIIRPTKNTTVIGLIDVSGSVRDFVHLDVLPPEGYGDTTIEYLRWWFRTATEDRRPDDRFGLIVFDGTTYAVATPTAGNYNDEQLDIRLADGTDLEGAIKLALAMMPPDTTGRIVLASDGNETTGDATRAALQAAGGRSAAEADGETESVGIPIDVIPLPYEVRNEVIVEGVDAPPTAAQGATVTLRVTLSATDASSGLLHVEEGGETIDINGEARGTARRVDLAPGRNVILVDTPLPSRLIHRFKAYYQPLEEGTDTLVGNNQGEAFTVTPGKGSVLIVDNEEAPTGETLERALTRLDIETTRMLSSEVPQSLLAYQAYDLVLLNNVPSEQVGRPLQEMLVDYVRILGGGLVMIGGQDSFGAGGWIGSPLADILPVKLELPEQLIVPSAAVVIVLDNSGSMARTAFGTLKTKQEIANEGAATAIETLDPRDLFSVIAFNDSYYTVVPLVPRDQASNAGSLIRSIAPGGGTDLYPALDEAHRRLRAVEADVKHIIVLSDGQSEGAPFGELARRVSEDGISVSTIGVGDEVDEDTLRLIATEGGGVYYYAYNPRIIPKLFLRDIRIVRKPMIREIPFEPIVLPTGSPLVAGLPAPPPTLGGLVLTQARADDTAILAAVHPDGSPVLAHWAVESGQVAAFTSSAEQRWAQSWIRSAAYSTMWGQIARLIARPTASRDSELITEVVDGRLRIRLSAADRTGEPIDLLSVPGTVYRPNGERIPVTLRQTGPGTYESSIPAEDSGNYVVALTPRKGAKRLAPVIGGVSRPLGPEYGRMRSDVSLLRRIAETTGGELLDLEDPGAAALYDPARQREIKARLPIWMNLIWWSLGLMLLDVATRRIAWDRYVSRAAAAEFVQRATESVRSRSEEVSATLGSLKTKTEQSEADRRELTSGVAKLKGDGGKMRVPPPRRGSPAPDEAEQRRSVRDALASLQGKPSAPPPPPDDSDDESPDATDTTSGLLAAKRRARDRYRDPNDDA